MLSPSCSEFFSDSPQFQIKSKLLSVNPSGWGPHFFFQICLFLALSAPKPCHVLVADGLLTSISSFMEPGTCVGGFPCLKTVPFWAFSKHLLRGAFLSSWNHTSPKQSMCTSMIGIIALSQNILSPICLSHQTGSFYRTENRTLIFESLVDVAGWLNGCAGGVCNFLRSVFSQQKLEATDGPVLQPLDRPVLQLHVTAQFYLESKGKHILEAWGNADSTQKEERP